MYMYLLFVCHIFGLDRLYCTCIYLCKVCIFSMKNCRPKPGIKANLSRQDKNLYSQINQLFRVWFIQDSSYPGFGLYRIPVIQGLVYTRFQLSMIWFRQVVFLLSKDLHYLASSVHDEDKF
jgi:hypothetical protein